MQRIITQKLVNWKNQANRKPLLVRGARQVGKSTTIVEFGKTHFSGNCFWINFEKNPEIHEIFERNFDVARIISELELFLDSRIVIDTDLLFFDEIQECPKAITALRYFYEQVPNMHVIAAGSLLEFALPDIPFPVGRIQMLSMYPMNFYEFLLAKGKALLADSISTNTPLSEFVLDMINNELNEYFMVGGMPECVKTYVETGSFQAVFDVQADLLATFRQDFSKYAGFADKRCLNQVLTGAAQKTGEQIKYAHLTTDFTNPTIKKAYELLETARLFTKVPAVSPAGIPLGASADEKKFKSIFLDIGLLSHISGFQLVNPIVKSNLAASFRGMLAEQFVGQEIRATGLESIYYWSRENRGSSAEVDYLIERNGDIIPIEVKSGKSGSLKSLHLLLETYSNIGKAYVFTEDKYGTLPDKPIEFLPLFCVGNL